MLGQTKRPISDFVWVRSYCLDLIHLEISPAVLQFYDKAAVEAYLGQLAESQKAQGVKSMLVKKPY
jgi:hypothetical protein